MTNFQLFEAIGDIDDMLIEEVSKTSYKKHRYTLAISSLAACAVVALFIFVNQGNNYKNHPENQDHEIARNVPTDIPQETVEEKNVINHTEINRVEINKIDSKSPNAKFGGRLKEVTESQWQDQYGTEDFLIRHEKKYLLSFSKEQEILYGVVELELPDHQSWEIRVNNREMLDSSFRELKKTVIGNSEIAVCQIKNDGNFCAIVEGDNAVYTIEGDYKMTKKQFILLLKEIFEY